MTALSRILCPIDFDEHSGRAVARAQDLAARHGAELRLLHVLPRRPESLLMPTPAVADEAERTARLHLDGLARLIRDAGVRCDVAIVHGDPALHILQAARDGGADLIVMATHGRKGVPRVVLGSVTEAVLHATPCPLLTIPPRAPGVGGGFSRILCAVDFAPSSAATFAHALAMVQDSFGELTVLNVIDPAFSTSAPDTARASAEAALANLHRRLPAAVATWCVVHEAVRFGDTASEVLKAATEDEAQLIVVGAHARRPAVAAMVGSCADRIVRESSCAVLAVPAPSPVVPIPLFHPVYA
jgi:nucleotide-binding universal stress UspA family protein